MGLSLALALYFLGRAVIAILLPWSDAEPPARRVWTETRVWRWRGFSLRREGRQVVTTEAIEIIGGAVVILFVALGIAYERS